MTNNHLDLPIDDADFVQSQDETHATAPAPEVDPLAIPAFLQRGPGPREDEGHEVHVAADDEGDNTGGDGTGIPTLDEQVAAAAAHAAGVLSPDEAIAAHEQRMEMGSQPQPEPTPGPDGALQNEAFIPQQMAPEEPLVNPDATAGHNGPTPEEMKKEFFKDLKKYGADSGKGSAALPRLALRVIRAAADGLISLEKPVSGAGGKDDATLIYEAYTAEDSKQAEHTAGGAKANASKLRQLIALGCMTAVDGVVVADRAVKLREKMEDDELKPKPLYAALVDVARKQIDVDTMLSDDSIIDAMSKTPAEKSVEKEWAKVKKTVEGLVTGENAAGLKDNSPEAIQIQELVSSYVTKFETGGKQRALIVALVEQGYSEARATEIVCGK